MSCSHLEDQLSTLQLLQAMYPLPSELELSAETAAFLDEVEADPSTSTGLASFEGSLFLQVEGAPEDESLQLNFLLPLKDGSSASVIVGMRQPGWLSRSAFGTLSGRLGDPGSESSSEYLLPLLERLPEEASTILRDQAPTEASASIEPAKETAAAGKPERVWFWFPSLSSKEKRRDLVTFAEEDSLTGFVLAGKPGLLCVEGDGRVIDKYMARIKSESWSDIPSYQKKVTERLRRPLASMEARSFKDMTDITDSIPHYGQYNHRGEMGEVRRLMDQWGVGEDFGSVVMNAGS